MTSPRSALLALADRFRERAAETVKNMESYAVRRAFEEAERMAREEAGRLPPDPRDDDGDTEHGKDTLAHPQRDDLGG